MRLSPDVIRIMFEAFDSGGSGNGMIETRLNSTVAKEALGWLKANGLVSEGRATAKGVAWVNFICSTPLPVQKWELPERDKA